MPAPRQALVTPTGIRDGAPAALAALVERRGNAVLAYCEAVLHPPLDVAAAAEAFARFRAAIVGIGDAEALDPDALLLGATRHAAASLVPPPGPPPEAGGLVRRLTSTRSPSATVESQIPGLLAARAQGELSAADLERLGRHLARSPSSRAVEDAFARAEAAYQRPPKRTLQIGALSEIMGALAGAAPNVAHAVGGDEDWSDLEFVEDDDATDAEPDVDPPVRPLEPIASSAAAEAPSLAAEPRPAAEAPSLAAEPRPASREPVADAAGAEDRSVLAGAGTTEGVSLAKAAPAGLTEPSTGEQAALAAGRAIPRPPRRSLHLPHPNAHGALFRYVLPGGAVAVAAVVVLSVAGVFSGDPPGSSAAGPTTPGVPAAPPKGSPPVGSRKGSKLDASAQKAKAAAQKARREEARRRRLRRRAAAAKRAAAAAAAQQQQDQASTTTAAPETAADSSTASAPASTKTSSADATHSTTTAHRSTTTTPKPKPSTGTGTSAEEGEGTSVLPGTG